MTLVDTIESSDAQREGIRTRGLELLALAGGMLDDQQALVTRYLSSQGGEPLSVYYRPLVILAAERHTDVESTGLDSIQPPEASRRGNRHPKGESRLQLWLCPTLLLSW